MNPLTQLHADIETRVQAIRKDNTDWLCCLGCDGCCHRLSEIPLLTVAEWEWLKEGRTACSASGAASGNQWAFFYIPYMHSASLMIHEVAVRACGGMPC